jgi:hypothetical protein
MSRTASQPSRSFECAEPYNYHDETRPGFFSLLTQSADGKRRQRSHRLQNLTQALALVDPDCDTWISQAEFFKPNRQVVSLWRLPLAFLDLDTYKVPALAGLTPQALLTSLLTACDDMMLPQPSLVVHSGRGLQVKWLFERPVSARALPRWQAVQAELFGRLMRFGADPQALDASRVLRLPETVNTRGNVRAKLIHEARTPSMGGVKLASGIVAYDFEGFAETVLPHPRVDASEAVKARVDDPAARDSANADRYRRYPDLTVVASRDGKADNAARRGLVASQLAWDRIADIRRLAQLRQWATGAPEGERNLPLFLCACFLADAVIVPNLSTEIKALADELCPTWSAAQVRRCVSTVLSRADAAAKGQQLEFGGVSVDPRYRWKNTTLVERLAISPLEEREMRTIISSSEARRRDADRKNAARRALGVQTQEMQSAGREQQRANARLLRSQSLSIRAIATKLGLSVGTIHAYCAG